MDTTGVHPFHPDEIQEGRSITARKEANTALRDLINSKGVAGVIEYLKANPEGFIRQK
jgi:hypothetical protein